MKQRRPDDVIRCSADADPMSKTTIGPMKLSVIGPMKHPSRARHRADEVVLVGPYLCSAKAPVLEGSGSTVGKVRASTVFMSCSVHVSISDFFYYV